MIKKDEKESTGRTTTPSMLLQLSATTSSLSCAEAELAITRFAIARTLRQVFKGSFFVIRSPGMRKNRISWDISAHIFDQADLAVLFKPQKTHEERTASERWLRISSE